MKRMLVVLLVFGGLASSNYGQNSPRRRTIADQSNPGTPISESDRWEILRLSLAGKSTASPAINQPPHPDHLVPVSQLRIPSKAIKEFERSQKAFKSGDLRSSSAHLEKAVEIYPDFIDAHNALGIRFAQLGEYQKSLAQHETALAIDPNLAQSHEGLALTLLLLNRSPEAEIEARRAIDLDPQALAPRYVLARALIGQRHVTTETIEMLRQSENAVPNASLVLAQIYFTAGHTDQVLAELRHYLKAPTDADNKRKAECWLAQLSGQLAPAGCPADVMRPSFR
jgi:tetratricopeptide (TPR) repeat protein